MIIRILYDIIERELHIIGKKDIMKVSVGVSNRHIHLTEEHFKILFGEEAELHVRNSIHQPGQFAAEETVTICTPKAELKKVRIMGPLRPYTQVEISRTDAYTLGINPPVRDSGDIKGSEAITIVGPVGTIMLEEGCILANRHIHITPKQMELYELEGLDEVHVQVKGEKGGILSHVSLKVSEDSYFELHLDTDDANAFELHNGDIVTILEGKSDDI